MRDKLVELIAKYFEKLNPNSNHIIAIQLAGYLRNNGVTFADVPDNNGDCGCATCANNGNEAICSECAWDSKWEAKPMTNADRIRAMSDEELAELLDDGIFHRCVRPERECCSTCYECVKGWLKQPAEVDHDTD